VCHQYDILYVNYCVTMRVNYRFEASSWRRKSKQRLWTQKRSPIFSGLSTFLIIHDSSSSALSYGPMAETLTLSDLADQSMMSMFGLVDRNAPSEETSPVSSPSLIPNSKCCCKHKITTIACAIEAINSVFAPSSPNYSNIWVERKAKLTEILTKISFESTELCKYIHYDNTIPYTRNLIATDDENYTLLLLCWSPARESKIHDHPCQGCFVRTLTGSIQEWIYTINDAGDIVYSRDSVYGAGLTSFMSDDIGLHKIGNPHPTEGAMSLHLYVPPFRKCKVCSVVFVSIYIAAECAKLHTSSFAVTQAPLSMGIFDADRSVMSQSSCLLCVPPPGVHCRSGPAACGRKTAARARSATTPSTAN
jgi:cysteine dioxygenase